MATERESHADLLVIDNVKDLVNKRISFIRNRQQMNNPRDLRDGAYMVYDCEADSIYPNNTPNCNPVDRDEGAERVGHGRAVGQAIPLVRQKDKNLKSSPSPLCKISPYPFADTRIRHLFQCGSKEPEPGIQLCLDCRILFLYVSGYGKQTVCP